ncbi:MAG: hypothetical protein OXG33_06260 [Chloroflexi bacterium]|nr:hypothetical protein [Chloroflexota bacterium]
MRVVCVILLAALVLPACGEPQSEFDRLIGRLCARYQSPEFQTAILTARQENEILRDTEYWAIRSELDALGKGSATDLVTGMRELCPEAYWELQSVTQGRDLSSLATLDRLAMRACARLREPAVKAWLAGEAGAEADGELVEVFHAGRDAELPVLLEPELWVHCPELEEQIEAAIRVVSGGWEMMRARLQARETCAKLEHALGQRESARAGALALAWASELAALNRVDRVTAEVMRAGQPPLDPIAVPVLRRALEERCPEAAAAVSGLPG